MQLKYPNKMNKEPINSTVYIEYIYKVTKSEPKVTLDLCVCVHAYWVPDQAAPLSGRGGWASENLASWHER